MRCDRCGREIRSGEKSLSETVEVADPAAFSAAASKIRTVTMPLQLCAACAAKQSLTERWFLWAFLLTVGGLILAALFIQFVAR